MKWSFLCFLIPIAVLQASGASLAAEPVDYTRDIKSVLAHRCYACHGVLKQKGGLRLDTGGLIRKGGESGPAIEPGKSDESLLIELVTAGEGTRMPPEGEPLSPSEIAHLRAWIDAGAPSPEAEPPQKDPAKHWAYVEPVRHDPPVTADAPRPSNPIDAFLAAGRAQLGLKPAPSAEKSTLLRRISLDLTGLLPSRDDLHAFEADRSPDAYERLVERLLASPSYGERWGRHWMDIWRYSDWAGFGPEVRESQRHIWRWRDWIVESLNKNRPYDLMIREMLAGDELAPEDPATLRATGFLVRNWYKFDRNTWLDATVEHTAKAFLGITLNCARCHDHKYDPFAQVDYYRFRAFFQAHDVVTDRLPDHPDPTQDGVARVLDAHAAEPTYLFRRGDEKQPDKAHPLTPGVPARLGGVIAISGVPLPVLAHYPALQPHIRREAMKDAETRLSDTAKALEKARRSEDSAREQFTLAATRIDGSQADRSAREQTFEAASADVLACSKELAAAQAGLIVVRAKLDADEARFSKSADPKRVDSLAARAAHAERQAAVIAAEAAVSRARHASVAAPAGAKAKAAEANVAKAKVALAAAVKSAASGSSTAYTPFEPARPAVSTGRRTALARWITDRKNPLAARVAVNHVWARHFGKPLVSTMFDFGVNGKPPTHPEVLDWLAVELMESGWSLKHLHRLIVTSDAYRMRSWAPAGDPGTKRDPENLTVWRMNSRRMEAELVRDNVLRIAGDLDLSMSGPDLDQDLDSKVTRRSVYFRHANEKVSTFLRIFDSANPVACYRRDVSIVPQQALALANSPLAFRESRVLAGKLADELGGDLSADATDRFITASFEQVLGRPPTLKERDACIRYLTSQVRLLSDPSKLTPIDDGPASSIDPSPDPRQRARENLVHVLMNHHDFVTIR